MLTVRAATAADTDAILALHRLVSGTTGGLARQPDEITPTYVEGFVSHSLHDGVIVVAEVEGISGLAGELHAYRNPLRLFSHVMCHLTIAVHPAAQGRGTGKALFTSLMETVRTGWPDIVRVELMVADTNARAMHLYESMGFVREGRFDRGIRAQDGTMLADIPMAWLRDADA